MARLFGTDGVRGIANEELTNQLAYDLGFYGAKVIPAGKKKATFIVGRDTRISGPMLEASLTAGILAAGCNVIKVGVLPTPAVSYLVRKLGADAGVVISASHNPYEHNGIKFFNHEGFKLTDHQEDLIESAIQKGEYGTALTHGDIGCSSFDKRGVERYVEFVLDAIEGVDLSEYKVVLDCANGASYESAPKAFKQMGAHIDVIHDHPDGLNINVDCGSTHTNDISQRVVQLGADFGFAFDGDADRLIAIDEKGQAVDGDKIMAICGKYLKDNDMLKGNMVVTTVMSNLGFHTAMKEESITTMKTKVGDRYVLEAMREGSYCLGGEQSGHIIFLDFNTTGDGLLSAAFLAKVIATSGKTLSELASMMEVFPQVLLNAKVPNTMKHTFMENPVIADAIKKVEETFHGEGRVLIRPSGTEPLVRVMLEGKDQAQLVKEAKALVELIEATIK